MDLEQYLQRWPNYELAKPESDSEIKNFCLLRGIEGKQFAFEYQREPSFFDFSQCQGDQVYTFIARLNKKIVGMGTVQVRSCYLYGKDSTIGYLSDLLINREDSKKLQWRQFVSDLLANAPKISEFKGVQHFLGVFVDDNILAKSALYGSKRESDVLYKYLAGYHMVNLLAKPFPFLSKTNNNLKAATAEETDKAALIQFLDNEQKNRAFGYKIKNGEWEYREKIWKNFSLERFFIVKDPQGKILGTCLPWSPAPSKKIYIRKLPIILKFIQRYNLLDTWLRIPGIDKQFKVLYLSNLEVDHKLNPIDAQRVFLALVDQMWQDIPRSRYHCISFADFYKRPLLPKFSPYLCNKIPMQMRLIHHKNFTVPKLTNEELPGFEMALV